MFLVGSLRDWVPRQRTALLQATADAFAVALRALAGAEPAEAWQRDLNSFGCCPIP